MGKIKTALLMFAFFGILATNTAFHPFDHWEVQSRPLQVLDGVVHAVLVSWAGETISAIILGVLAIVIPAKIMLNGAPAASRHAAPSSRSTASPSSQPAKGFGRRQSP